MLLVLLLLVEGAAAASDSRLTIESRAGRAGVVQWQSAHLTIAHTDEAQDGLRWQVDIVGLDLAGLRGRLSVECADGGWRQGRPRCADGRFEWLPGDDGPRLSGRLAEPARGSGMTFELDGHGLSGRLQWSDEQSLDATLRLADFELAALPAGFLAMLDLSVLEGRADGLIELSDEQISFELSLDQAGFDRQDGRVAGAGLALDITGEINGWAGGEAVGFSAGLQQHKGEMLVGPVYLPPPEKPLVIEVVGEFEPGSHIALDALTLDDGGLVEAQGAMRLESGAQGWRLAELTIDEARLQLPGGWRRWGDGPASARGFGDLATGGTLTASARWLSGRLESLSLGLDDFSVRDAAGRFALESVNGNVRRGSGRVEADLEWGALELFSLAFGASRLLVGGAPADWALEQPLRLPLLDGAVVIDRLAVDARVDGSPSVGLDARIEPLDLAELTRMLGFPVFGGALSGQFPGITLSGDQIAFTGGIDVAAFSGGIRLSELVIERPFGSLPALAAQVEIDRLDLAELTGAFNFGHMEGELSGWMHDLRLLDWQPVAMDARLFTHEDVPRRRISQRAVENLSRLGGGAAAIGATVLRMFEEFPYRRAGLACRLDRNICHIDGVAPHESGGFYIVEGRGLPHLDVVGHRRLIDWPRLVAQLMAATEG
ncbi:MAG: hypothetical protein U5L08_03460 [Xanthomonadales bacterium]|nr:hypothetical protein [Xanthomonadales bacterium]